MTRTNTKRKKEVKKELIKKEINKEIIGIIIISIGFLILASILSNSTGAIGKFTKIRLLELTGFGAFVIPYIIIIIGILFTLNRFKINEKKKTASLIIVFINTLTYLDIRLFPFTDGIDRIKLAIEYGKIGQGGGLLGSVFSYVMLGLFGTTGSYIIMNSLVIISVLVFTNISIIKVIKTISKHVISIMKKSFIVIKDFIYVNKTQKDNQAKPIIINNNIEKILELEHEALGNNITNDLENKIKILDYTKAPEKLVKDADSKKSANISSKDVGLNTININKNCDNIIPYRFPTTDLLNKSIQNNNTDEKKEIVINAKKLEETLLNFGIEANVNQISRGPTITRYELQPAPGVKVSRIVNLSDDIALNLAASDIRIEAPIPGKSAIGIEVPNKSKVSVSLREVIESSEYKTIESKLPFALGKDIAGKPIISNIEKMPHLLIAGATGSGKSVCINTLIMSILYKAKPDEVKLLLIDPKVVELSIYNGIPHLLIPVVTDPKKASGALNWAVQEMTKRYSQFASLGVRDIFNYNIKAQNDDTIEKLPQIVVIIDELADLMMVSASEVEDYICRLAQMARAAGIHLIVATQRPSVDIITGTIKANIPSRISFAVTSNADSRTILDMGGAEKLLGKGDMLYYPVGESKPLRLQGAFIDEKEVERIVNYVKNQCSAEYADEIIENIESDVILDLDSSDELLPKAIEMVVEEGQASISLLQRRLKIGYARAARLVDEMEERGVIGGYEGSKPRKVLASKESLGL